MQEEIALMFKRWVAHNEQKRVAEERIKRLNELGITDHTGRKS